MARGKFIKGDIGELHQRQANEKKNTPVYTQAPVQLYTPHSGQMVIHQWLLNNPKKKWLILSCGRRFGKSLAMINQALYYALTNDNEKIVFFTQTYKLGKELFDILNNALGNNFKYYQRGKGITPANLTELKFKFINGSTIQFFSFEKPENLRGLSATRMFIDEASLLPDDAFNTIIKPITILAKTVVALSTPRGKIGWFYKLFIKGQDYTQRANYKSFQFPTSSNPMIPKSELEDAKNNIPEHIYTQEYEAEFIDSAFTLFKNIDECTNNDFLLNPNDKVVCGVDVGRQVDKTIITVMRVSDRQVIFQEGWNKMDYNDIADNVAKVINNYKPVESIIETNNVGDFFFDALKLKTKYKLTSFYTLPLNKNYIIENLILAFEKGDIRILDNGDLKFELDNFTCIWNSASRTLKYAGRSGVHDDRVMSLAFALEAARRNTTSGKLSYSMINMPSRR